MSCISIVDRLVLSIQLRSLLVQGVTGLISKRSASVADASAFASFAVTPLAEKQATESF